MDNMGILQGDVDTLGTCEGHIVTCWEDVVDFLQGDTQG